VYWIVIDNTNSKSDFEFGFHFSFVVSIQNQNIELFYQKLNFHSASNNEAKKATFYQNFQTIYVSVRLLVVKRCLLGIPWLYR